MSLTDLALHRELNDDYVNILSAIESGHLRGVGHGERSARHDALLKNVARTKDREATLKLLTQALEDNKKHGIELITIQLPPGITLARSHNPKVFGDDGTARRKMVAGNAHWQAILAWCRSFCLNVLNIFGTTPILDGSTVLGTGMDIGALFGDTFVKSTGAGDRFGADAAAITRSASGRRAERFATTISRLRRRSM